MTKVPTWLEAHCYECHEERPIVAIRGVRKMPRSNNVMLAVRLSCGHERHGDDRVVVTEERKSRIEEVLMRAKLLLWQESGGVAGALSMTG